MGWRFSASVLPFFLVTAMCAGLAAHAWRRRATAGVVAPAALMFTLMMFGTATYAFSYAMQLGSTRLTAAIWWSRMSAPGALILGSAWLLFVLEYTARHARVTRLAHRWLWFIPLIVVLANWTNDLHGLYGTYRTLHITETYSVLLWDRGIIHNAGLAYSYIAGVVGITLLALSAVSTPAPYRRQEIWLIVGALAPLSVHIIMTTFLPSRIDIDPTAFAMALAGLIWSHGLFGLGLLDIVPMAQEIVLAGLSDGIIVLDERNRVVSLNPAAERIVARSVEEVVGLPIEPLLPTHCLPADDDEDALFDCENEQGRRSYEVRYAPLRRRDGYFIGRLVTLHDVTHRLQMQRAVEEAKESYQTLFDNAGDAIFIHDLHGRFLEANRIACERLGYTRDELLQMSPQDLDDPEHAARVSDRMAKLQSAGYAQFETVHRRRDGTTFPVEIVARVVEYHGEKAVLAVARDITERKLAEAALRWDEMLIDTLMEQVPDRIYFKDLRSRFIRINHAMARYFGLDSPDDAVGKTDFDFFTEEHARPAFEDEQRIIETGEPIVNKEEKEVLIDGRVSWALTTKLPLYDSDGKLMGTCGISRDITERKEISRKLQETTDELERFFTVSLDMLCIADLDGYFRRVNKAWEKGLGYSVEELEGRRFIDFVHPDDVEMTLNELRGLSSRQPILDFTNRYRRRDGSYRYIEWSSQSQGRVAYSAARDITDRIASEEALRQSEAQYRTLIEQAADAIFVLDVQGRFVNVNDSACQMLGYTRDELLSLSNRDTSRRDDAEQLEQDMEALRSGESLFKEWALVRKDGILVMGELNARYLGDGRIQAIIRDITGRKEAEDVLRRFTRELAIRNRIAQVFLTGVNERIYGDVLDIVLQAMESPYGILGYVENEMLICPSMTHGVWEQCRLPNKNISFPRERWNGIWGRALFEQRAFYSNELLAVPEGHVVLNRAMAVPIVHHGESVGLLMVANKARDYDTADVELMEAIAAHIAPILHAMLQKQHMENERERLIRELQESLARVKTLSGLLPICASCKKIRDDGGYWKAVEVYVEQHSEAEFTHGICPECARKLYGEFFEDEEGDDHRACPVCHGDEQDEGQNDENRV